LADAIFRGKAVSVKHSGFPLFEDHQEVTFLIDAVWKGSVAQKATVHVTSYPRMCDGYEFKIGYKYVIYVGRKLPTEWENTLDSLRARMGLTVDLPATLTTFDIPNCPLRIRRDFDLESETLGRARTPK
jgi:hypothetical protein